MSQGCLKIKGKEILGLITVVELNKLKGRLKLDFPVESIISINEKKKKKKKNLLFKLNLIKNI